ncbi:MAG: hypothetical protein ACI4M6_01950 [Christensenellaceae bacterium]
MDKNSIFDIIKKLGEVAKNVQTDNPASSKTAPDSKNTTSTAPVIKKNLVPKDGKQAVHKQQPPSKDAILQMINEHNRRASKIKNKQDKT